MSKIKEIKKAVVVFQYKKNMQSKTHIKEYKKQALIFTDGNNSISFISLFYNTPIITLHNGYKPIKRKGGYIDIVMEGDLKLC